MRYRDAGVDVTRAGAIKQAIGRAVRATWNADVRDLPDGFAGVMRFPGASALAAATMDGVGTKLHLAMAAGRLRDAAADLVRHGANDLLAHGAAPLAFLDYIAQSRLDPEVVLEIIEGLSAACRAVGAVLLGGETAEMPDTYLPGVVDVAGCMIGVVDPAHVLDGERVAPGDRVLALASDGLHTNGYSLARRVLAASGLALAAPLPGGSGVRVGDALLAPHRWYGPAVSPAIARGDLHGLAHVTGGGIGGNLVRVLPEGRRALIHADAWRVPAVFEWLIRAGEVPLEDARSALNLGLGMIAVCAARDAAALETEWSAAGERVFAIGEVAAGPRGVEWIG